MSAHDKALGAVVAVSLLAACSTLPEYGPRPPGGLVGYTDLQLSPNRYRVSFSGSNASTRDDVEVYLLRRAAEVTLQAGYTHFIVETRDIERSTRYVGDSFLYGYPYYYYPPYSPYWGGSAWPLNSYSTYAEIGLLRAEDATRNPEAIDALTLLQRLAPAPQFAAASATR